MGESILYVNNVICVYVEQKGMSESVLYVFNVICVYVVQEKRAIIFCMFSM